jgi:hypothetical protein
MSFTSAPKYYDWSNVSMQKFLDTPQNNGSITEYSVVEKKGMVGWNSPVYPIKFSFGDSKTINTDGGKMIQSATIQKSSVERDKPDVTINDLNELKSKYYLLINGKGTVTNGGKSRRRRQTKNKRKSRRTRRSRK